MSTDKIDVSKFGGIVADDLSELGDTQSAKTRILQFLINVGNEPTKDNKPLWVPVKAISDQAHVSNIYTRHVLETLVTEKKVLHGKLGKKSFYRIAPTELKPK